MVKKFKLDGKITRFSQKPILSGDSSPMVGFVGCIWMKLSLEDTIGVVSKTFEVNCLVYETLNHDFIIGQNSMVRSLFSFTCFPGLDVILFNATSRMYKKFSQNNRDRIRANNNIRQRVHPPELVEKVEWLNRSDSSDKLDSIFPNDSQPLDKKSGFNVTKSKFDDNESFYLTIPCATFNRSKFNKFNPTVQNIACNFMAAMEEASEQETALSKVLTEGGLDGLIDKNSITSTETKLINTKKGQVEVGSQLSDSMVNKLTDYINNFKGEVFNTDTLGKTEYKCEPELKPNLKETTAPPRYMPLNEFMRGEATKLVEQMVGLGVLEKSTLPANSTIFIVQKTSGKWRLICDLRKYNERLQDFVVHLPSPYELINKICKFLLFSYVDFPDAYFSMPMSDHSLKNNPVVASVSGMYYNFRYLRMPQGLKPATATFINMLNEIYAPIQEFVVNYLDDSVIGSDDDEELHFTQLKKFIQITSDSGLKIALQ